MRVNCFEPKLSILAGNRFNDYLQFHIFACNYIGFTVSLMGYGISAQIRIYDPSRRRDSDSKDTYRETDGQQQEEV